MNEQTQNQHLNAAQLQQLERRFEQQFNSVVERLQLRRWAVEQAMTICASLSKATAGAITAGETQGLVIDNPMGLAKTIYEFVAQPGVPLKIDLTA